MSKVFLKATTSDGSQHISEFSKLGKISRYVRDVLRGAKPFNVWHITGTTHPTSGEPTLIRTRTFIQPALIVSVVQVERKPDAPANSYLPIDFVPVEDMQRGSLGLWTAPAGIDGAVEGQKYPLHQDNATLERYVWLRYSEDESEAVKYVVNPSAVYHDGSSAGDDDDELDDER